MSREGEPPGRGARGGLAEASLRRADADLLAAVDGAVASATRKAGSWLACKIGCAECCIRPFPITRLDAWRLRRGLADLAAREPDRAAAVLERAKRSLETLRAGFPGDAATGRLCGDEAAEDLYFERHDSVPCPVLDPQTGACELYATRPISCRTYGPPVTFGGEKLAPCRLCFIGAPPETIEACRVEPDRDRIEAAILDRLAREDGESWETIIAFAIALEDP